MVDSSKKVIIKDATLREGLDVPNVNFSVEQRLKIAKLLNKANVPEIEVVAPGKVLEDLKFVKRLKEEGLQLQTSGLLYSFNPRCQEEIQEASGCLNRFDILMPVSTKRKPYDKDNKISLISDVLSYSLRYHSNVGVGFPNSMQTEIEFLLEIGKEAINKGAKRVTIYDTNGGSDPFAIYDLIKRLKEDLNIPLLFHGHNDLGLSTANSLAAVYAGAGALDVTINGLGDRAGNASFEQVVLGLHLKGFNTGVILKDLRALSKTVEEESGIEVSRLAPIVGEYILCHKSPGHLESPELFEAFDPQLIDSYRRLDKT